MNKKVIAVIIIVLVLGVAGVLVFGRKSPSDKTAHSNTSGSSSTQKSSESGNTSAANNETTISSSKSFTVSANDNSADQESITVAKGTKVSLTFKVETSGVYHGGLQFKSTNPQLDSGPIAPGDSKTVTFTADHTFSFQPYWYASGVKKDYLVTVNVN